MPDARVEAAMRAFNEASPNSFATRAGIRAALAAADAVSQGEADRLQEVLARVDRLLEHNVTGMVSVRALREALDPAALSLVSSSGEPQP